MLTKMFELRDKSTFIPILCTALWPRLDPQSVNHVSIIAETYLLRRLGYDMSSAERKPILLCALTKDKCVVDPYEWNDRTFQTAHLYITKNWPSLISGQVIDVEFILGETSMSKPSERITNKDLL